MGHGRIASWLGARKAPWLVIAIGLALAAPALTADFTADDHLHRLVERSDPGVAGVHSRPLDVFVFASGDPIDNARLRDAGVFPWWSDPALRLSFMRPISSATHALDHALWPDSAPAQLAQNLVWLGLALVVAWLFFRRFTTVRWIAVLALALYAFDDARGPVVGWIANRNALIALVLAVPALLAHDRWRRDDWTAGRWVGPALFAVSLGAGESAVAILAYLLAHALWLDRGRWRDRALALAPYVVVVVAWRLVYTQLGYGVVGSGIYLDPGAAPSAFASAAAVRIPLILLGQLGLPWSDLASLYPVVGGLGTVLAIAVATFAAIGFACSRLLVRDPVTRFFATGMVLAVVPVASTFPADRLLGFIGLGAMGLVAQLLAAALCHRDQLGDGRVRRIGAVVVALVMVVVHVVLAPPLLVMRSRSMIFVGTAMDRADAGIPHTSAITDQTVIIVAAPSDALAGFLPLMRQSRGQPRPAHLYWLATTVTAVRLERVDERTLRVVPSQGFLRYELDQMTRSPRERPFVAGDSVALAGVTIEIERVTDDGRPASVLARFALPLEDPSLVWRRWQGHTYVPYAPPAVGSNETLPAVDFRSLLD